MEVDLGQWKYCTCGVSLVDTYPIAILITFSFDGNSLIRSGGGTCLTSVTQEIKWTEVYERVVNIRH